MRSLNSRKYVNEIFNWQWHYYFLKPEGIKYLREYLGLPETVIPNTHKQDVGKTEEATEEQAVDQTEGRRGDRGERGTRGRGTRGNRGERGTRGRGRGGRVDA
jgi:small subunit ribosomal protein S10e